MMKLRKNNIFNYSTIKWDKYIQDKLNLVIFLISLFKLFLILSLFNLWDYVQSNRSTNSNLIDHK